MARRTGHAFGLAFKHLEGSFLASVAFILVNFISVSSSTTFLGRFVFAFAEVSEGALIARCLTFLKLVLAIRAGLTVLQSTQAERTRIAFLLLFAISITTVAGWTRLARGLALEGLISSVRAVRAPDGARLTGELACRALFRGLVHIVALVTGRA
jgi:hypothetical protein